MAGSRLRRGRALRWRLSFVSTAVVAMLNCEKSVLPPKGAPNLDLAVTKTVNKTSALPGDTLVWTVTVKNNGPISATSVLAGDTLPTGVTAVPGGTTATVGTYATNGVWTIGSLAVGASAQLTLTATINAATSSGTNLINRAGALSSDQNDSVLTNNIAGTTTLVGTPGPTTEPAYDPSTGTLIYVDSMDEYTSAADMWNATGTTMRIRQGFAVDTPASQVISPGYGGAGKALRVTYAGTDQEGHDWDLLNAPYLPDTTTHFFQYYARVTMSAPLTSTLPFKWFMVFHPAGDRNQWNTHDHLPCPLQASPDPHTYWQDYDVSTLTYCQANQPIPPYPGQVFDGQWHRFTYQYRPNTSAGSRDGISRMWVDGTKIIDISASAVGVTPPGGYKPWCNLDDLDALYTQGINLVRWFSTLTSTVPSFTADIDNFMWWVKK